ncbi:hypothetical protein B0H13DRAFT_1651486 [Mycena leptocephala]|nr:hypothetical protein B0H13DRAFT_1651486 [Mycena leptocephala]
MHTTECLGPLDVCTSCHTSLRDGKQPLDSWANFQYYAFDELPLDISVALRAASMFDLMLISHSCTTRITHLYSNKDGSPQKGSNPATSQRYNQGNVAIMPQDIASVRPLLPPDRSDIQEAMCALFVGANTAPTDATVHKLHPILVSKSRIKTLLDFLLTSNPLYKRSVRFSQANMDDLFSFANRKRDTSVPRAAEISCLPLSTVQSSSSATYAARAERFRPSSEFEDDPDGIVMEAVGYTADERTPQAYTVMKASALAWCLDYKKFINMQPGSSFISEKDYGMLTYVFPHLDPWGIGGFHEPL